MQDIGVIIKPCKSLHINQSLLRLIDVLEQILHLDLAESLQLLLILCLSLLDLLDLLLLGYLNLVQWLLHGLHDLVCHPIMSLGYFLFQLLAHFPVLLRMLVRHLVELGLDLGGLGSELLDEFELDHRLVCLWRNFLRKLVYLLLRVLIVLR